MEEDVGIRECGGSIELQMAGPALSNAEVILE
jgi:hypothetical protein